MEKVIKEISLQETLNYLKEQKVEFLGGTLKTGERFIKKIDELIEKTKSLMSKDNLDNIVVVGSLVDLRIKYDDGEIEHATYYLGLDFAEDTISIFSPLGTAVYGAKTHETVSYDVHTTHDVNSKHMEATILNKNVIVEKFPDEIILSNPVFGDEDLVKKKI